MRRKGTGEGEGEENRPEDDPRLDLIGCHGAHSVLLSCLVVSAPSVRLSCLLVVVGVVWGDDGAGALSLLRCVPPIDAATITNDGRQMGGWAEGRMRRQAGDGMNGPAEKRNVMTPHTKSK